MAGATCLAAGSQAAGCGNAGDEDATEGEAPAKRAGKQPGTSRYFGVTRLRGRQDCWQAQMWANGKVPSPRHHL